MKKLMACILSLALLCPLFPVVDAAPSVRVPILVTEQNGVLVNRQLFRRGIAFAKGELYNTDDLCVVDAVYAAHSAPTARTFSTTLAVHSAPLANI